MSDADCGGGDGITWYIDRETTDIASGSISNCGSETRLSRPISVHRGTTFYFVIDPKADYSFDLTEIDLTIYRPPVPPSYDLNRDRLDQHQHGAPHTNSRRAPDTLPSAGADITVATLSVSK